MKNLVVVVGGSVVEYSMVVRDVNDVYALVNILSCLEYKSNEWHDLADFLYKAVDSRLDSDCNNWSEWYKASNALWSLEDELFYNDTIDDFNEYCTHMNEPDFDWGYYSDWHKDLFGFRPRR